MYIVRINVDPKIIGHGELAALISDAVQKRLIDNMKEDQANALVRVTYERPVP